MLLFNSNNILKAITDALGHLVKMREKEGKNIYDDMIHNQLEYFSEKKIFENKLSYSRV